MMVQWLHLCHHHIRCHPPVARSSDDDRNPDVCCRCCCLLLSPASHSSPGSHFRCLIPECWSSSGLWDWKIVRVLFVCFHCSEPGHYLCQDIILCAVLCWAQRIQSHAIIRTFVSMAKSSCFLRTQFYCLQSSISNVIVKSQDCRNDNYCLMEKIWLFCLFVFARMCAIWSQKSSRLWEWAPPHTDNIARPFKPWIWIFPPLCPRILEN